MYTLKKESEVLAWLKKMNIKNYKITKIDEPNSPFCFSVSVNKPVNISNKSLKYFPIQFDEIIGTFDCSHNELTSLLGAPLKMNNSFDASHNKITSLEYCPILSFGSYDFSYNNIKSLKGLPKYIPESLYFSFNEISTLDYAPEKVNQIASFSNNKITTIKGLQIEVGATLALFNNPIDLIEYEDLKDIKTASFALSLSLKKILNVKEEIENEKLFLIDYEPLKNSLFIQYEKVELEKMLENKPKNILKYKI